MQRSLGDGLALPAGEADFVTFRDPNRGLEYIRSCRQIHEQGLYIELSAYQRHVFLDFSLIQDNEWHQYAQLTEFLGGRGVPSIAEALKELFLQPMLQAFQELVNPGSIRWLVDQHYGAAAPATATREAALAEVQTKLVNLLGQVIHFTGASGDVAALAAEICQDLEAALDLPGIEKIFPWPRSRPYKAALQYLKAGNAQRPPLDAYDLEQWATILVLVFSRKLGKILSEDPAEYGEISRAWFDEWLLGKFTSKALQDMGVSDGRAERAILLIRLLVSQQGWNKPLSQDGRQPLPGAPESLPRQRHPAFCWSQPLPGIIMVQPGELRRAFALVISAGSPGHIGERARGRGKNTPAWRASRCFPL